MAAARKLAQSVLLAAVKFNSDFATANHLSPVWNDNLRHRTAGYGENAKHLRDAFFFVCDLAESDVPKCVSLFFAEQEANVIFLRFKRAISF